MTRVSFIRMLAAMLFFSVMMCACKPGGLRSNGNASSNIASDPTKATNSEVPKVRSADRAVSATVVSEVHLKAGGTSDASVKVTIEPGFHVNANPPSDPAYIPTQLFIDSANGLGPGKPAYPAPTSMKKFQFSANPLAVYEGDIVIKVPVMAARSATKGNATLKGRVKAQPCDEAVCYPPRDIEISIPVAVE